jgi:Zn-dependent peptidase ImmA (M78 family)
MVDKLWKISMFANTSIPHPNMENYFPERLRTARALSGFSLQELSDKLANKVTRQALHKYEKGEALPDSEMIRLLSRVLDVSESFFSRIAKPVELGTIEFRKAAKMPVKEQDRLIEKVRDRLSRYLEIEELLALTSSFSNPISHQQSIGGLEDIEVAAQALRSDWGLGCDPISNCIDLIEDHHIKVIEVESTESFDGMQTWVNGNLPLIAINATNIKSSDRKRFTVLHELAHLLLPFGTLSVREREKYCHQFAAALLLPEKSAKAELGNSRSKLLIPELGAIKKQYGISIQAIVMRARDLKIITESYYKQFFFYINQMGWRTEEPVKYEGFEKSNRFDQLIFRALAEEIITIDKAAELSNLSIQQFQQRLSMF